MNDSINASSGPRHDPSIVRTPVRIEDIRFRGDGLDGRTARRIRRALRTLHTLETMAVAIYRFQIGRERSELNRHLIAAMCNEMTHRQDFHVKLCEHGWRPSPLAWMYGMVGTAFGLSSRLGGKRGILRMGVWVETKAVRHYGELLESVPWDEETRSIIEKDGADEEGHIARWRDLLAAVDRRPAGVV